MILRHALPVIDVLESVRSKRIILPKPIDVVPSVVQVLEDVWLPCFDAVRLRAMPGGVHVPTSDDGVARGRTLRVQHVRLCAARDQTMSEDQAQ